MEDIKIFASRAEKEHGLRIIVFLVREFDFCLEKMEDLKH